MIKISKQQRDKYFYEAFNMFLLFKNNLVVKSSSKNICLCKWNINELPLFLKNNDISKMNYCNEKHKIKYFYIGLYFEAMLREYYND